MAPNRQLIYVWPMESSVMVTVDPSCFPGKARAAYLDSFRSRRMDHQFLYNTEKQAQLWLAIHEAYSPARTDADCRLTYAQAFRGVADFLGGGAINIMSVGCGGGQKDDEMLSVLSAFPREY